MPRISSTFQVDSEVPGDEPMCIVGDCCYGNSFYRVGDVRSAVYTTANKMPTRSLDPRRKNGKGKHAAEGRNAISLAAAKHKVSYVVIRDVRQENESAPPRRE